MGSDLSYTGDLDLKNWSNFLLGNGVSICKIAAGGAPTFVLGGALGCGRLVVMKPKKDTASTWSILWMLRLLRFLLECRIVVVVDVDLGEDNGEDFNNKTGVQAAVQYQVWYEHLPQQQEETTELREL